MIESEITHEKVNKLLRNRCANSCGHHRDKTPNCWKACQTAREYIEHYWKIKFPPHRFASYDSVEVIGK